MQNSGSHGGSSTGAHSAEPKRDFEKCGRCRTDRKKCENVTPPEHNGSQSDSNKTAKCKRCKELNYPCGPRIKSPRKTKSEVEESLILELAGLDCVWHLLIRSRYEWINSDFCDAFSSSEALCYESLSTAAATKYVLLLPALISQIQDNNFESTLSLRYAASRVENLQLRYDRLVWLPYIALLQEPSLASWFVPLHDSTKLANQEYLACTQNILSNINPTTFENRIRYNPTILEDHDFGKAREQIHKILSELLYDCPSVNTYWSTVVSVGRLKQWNYGQPTLPLLANVVEDLNPAMCTDPDGSAANQNAEYGLTQTIYAGQPTTDGINVSQELQYWLDSTIPLQALQSNLDLGLPFVTTNPAGNADHLTAWQKGEFERAFPSEERVIYQPERNALSSDRPRTLFEAYIENTDVDMALGSLESHSYRSEPGCKSTPLQSSLYGERTSSNSPSDADD